MTDLRTELEQLEDRQLAYVVARSKCFKDADALKEIGLSKSTFYKWDASERESLNTLAQRFKHEIAMRVLMKLQDHAEESVDVITGLMKSRNDNIKLKAAQDVLDRSVGKPTQRQEVTGADGSKLVINLSWDDEPEDE